MEHVIINISNENAYNDYNHYEYSDYYDSYYHTYHENENASSIISLKIIVKTLFSMLNIGITNNGSYEENQQMV